MMTDELLEQMWLVKSPEDLLLEDVRSEPLPLHPNEVIETEVDLTLLDLIPFLVALE